MVFTWRVLCFCLYATVAVFANDNILEKFRMNYTNLGLQDWDAFIQLHNTKVHPKITTSIYSSYPIKLSVKNDLENRDFHLAVDFDKSWDRFRQRFFLKLRKALTNKLLNVKADPVTFNVYFSTGSVGSGIGCFPADPILYDTAVFEDISSWCAWTRRFVNMMQTIVDRLTNAIIGSTDVRVSDSVMLISPKICSRGGACTIIGVDLLKSREYHTWHCGSPNDYRMWPISNLSSSSQKNKTWEPDLIIWDHGINDNNPNFFTEKRRDITYEEFLALSTSLPTRPQVISMDFLHLYSSAIDERHKINVKYNVPHVNYVSFIRNIVGFKEATVWYAARFQNNHPNFPTHVIWAYLTAKVLFDERVLPVDGIMNYGKYDDSDLNNNDFIVTNISSLDSFCRNGFSTRFDFSRGNTVDATIVSSPGDSAQPLHLIGPWNLTSDMGHSSGWIFDIRHKHETSLFNQLSFRCNRPKFGSAQLSYLSSYGEDWGTVRVNITRVHSHVDHRGKQILVAVHQRPFFVHSRWNETFSILQDVEIPYAREHMQEMLYMDVSLVVVSGKRFKLLAFSCC